MYVKREFLYGVFFVVLLFSQLAKSFFHGFGSGYIELIILSLLFIVLGAWRYKNFNKFFLIYSLFLLCLIVSATRSEYYPEYGPMIFQFLVYMKLIFLVGVVISMQPSDVSWLAEKSFLYVKYVALLSIGICFLQYILPGFIAKIFPGQALDTYITGTNILRMTGIFNHPIPLGYFSVLGMYYSLSVMNLGCRYNSIIFFVCFVLLIFSGQRAEFLAFFLSFPLAYILKKIGFFRVRYFLFSTFLIGTIVYFSVDHLLEFYDFDNDSAARLVLYDGGFDLARDEFPFGSGLATYASSNSKLSLAYYDLEIERLWWYKNEAAFLTDTTWAMIVGESGYLGALVYVMALSYFFRLAISRAQFSLHAHAVAIFVVFYSLSNPIFTGSIFELFSGILLIFLRGYEKNNSHN